MIHPPSAAAFLRTICQAAGCLVATAAIADYATENRALRREVLRLSDIADTLMAANVELAEERDTFARLASDSTYRLAALLNHPSARKPLTGEVVVRTNDDALCEEFGREINYRLDEVTEEWRAR